MPGGAVAHGKGLLPRDFIVSGDGRNLSPILGKKNELLSLTYLGGDGVFSESLYSSFADGC